MFAMDSFSGKVNVDGAIYQVSYTDGQLVFSIGPKHAALLCDRLGQPSISLVADTDVEREAIQSEDKATTADVNKASPAPNSIVYESVNEAAAAPAEETAADDEPAEEPAVEAASSEEAADSELTDWDRDLIERMRKDKKRTSTILTELGAKHKKASSLLEHARRLQSELPPLKNFFKMDDWKDRLERRCEVIGVKFDL